MNFKYFGGLLFVASILVVSKANEMKEKEAAEAVTKVVDAIYKVGGPDKFLEAVDKHNIKLSERAKKLIEKIEPYLDPSKLKKDDTEVQTRRIHPGDEYKPPKFMQDAFDKLIEDFDPEKTLSKLFGLNYPIGDR